MTAFEDICNSKMSLRQGRKRLIDAFEEISNKRQRTVPKNNGPLSGVVVCLTGLKTEQKTKFHKMIEALGGRYVSSTEIVFFFSSLSAHCTVSFIPLM